MRPLSLFDQHGVYHLSEAIVVLNCLEKEPGLEVRVRHSYETIPQSLRLLLEKHHATFISRNRLDKPVIQRLVATPTPEKK